MKELGRHLTICLLAALFGLFFFSACQMNPFQSSSSGPSPKLPIGASSGTPDGEDDPWFVEFKVVVPAADVNGKICSIHGVQGAVENADASVDTILIKGPSPDETTTVVVAADGSFAADMCFAAKANEKIDFYLLRGGVEMDVMSEVISAGVIHDATALVAARALTIDLGGTSDDHFWVGTRWSGLFYCSPRKMNSLGSCLRFQIDSYNPQLRLPANGVTALFEMKNAVLIGTYTYDREAYLSLLEKNSSRQGVLITSYKVGSEARVNKIAQAGDGTIFVGTHAGLLRFSGSAFETVPLPDGLPYNIVQLLADSAGGLWVAANKQGDTKSYLWRYEPSGSRWANIPVIDFDTPITDLLEVSSGVLFVGTTVGIKVVQGGEVAASLAGYEGCISSENTRFVQKFLKASNGAIYVGTYQGFGMCANANFEYKESLDVSNIIEMVGKNFMIQSGGTGKITFYDSVAEKFETFNEDSLLGLKATELLDVGGVKWIGTDDGLFLYESGSLSRKMDGHINDILEIANGKVLIGTDLKLKIYQNGLFSDVSTGAINVTQLLKAKDGRILVGTAAGLMIYDGSLVESGILASITALCEVNDGVIWIGTPSGIFQYQNSDFSLLDGLYINQIVKGDDGAVWVLAEGQFLYNSSDSFAAPVLDTFNLDMVPEGRLFKGFDGTIWVGDSASLRYFKDGWIHTSYSIPPLPIISFLEFASGETWVGAADGIRIFQIRELL